MPSLRPLAFQYHGDITVQGKTETKAPVGKTLNEKWFESRNISGSSGVIVQVSKFLTISGC